MKREFPIIDIYRELRATDLLPAIVFRSARKQCDADVLQLTKSRACLLTEEEQVKIRTEINTLIVKYSIVPEAVTEHPQYEPSIAVGAGAHHAGQLLIWRLILEELMSRGLMKMMLATGTVAAGVDFPARTVVVTAHSRRGNEGYQTFSSAEFQQMSGRAGRRGRDLVGYCLVAPSVHADARLIGEVAKRPPEPLRSAYFAAPATVLNIMRFRNVDDLRYIVSRSLASFLDGKSAKRLRADTLDLEEKRSGESGSSEWHKKFEKRIRRELKHAEELEGRQLAQLERSLQGLATLGFVINGMLTAKGRWAANLCTSLVLELAEAIEDKLFDDLSTTHLAGIIASISGDSHKTYLGIRKNPIPKELFQKIQAVLERVANAYERPPTTVGVEVVPDAGLTVITWMEAESWSEYSGILRLSGVAEGDVARLVSQTADALHQISRLTESHPILAATANEARGRLLRPPLSEVIVTL